MSDLNDIFRAPTGYTSLPLQEERELIIAAKTGNGDATWMLLLQYRGLLQRTVSDVQKRLPRQLTPEQLEDLQSDLVLAAVEGIQSFDLDRFIRLSQVLPGKLRDVALEMTTALAVPRGTLALWFKVWREAGQEFEAGALLAPERGMSPRTFRAIAHALEFAGSEWVTVPDNASRMPAPDEETYRLAHAALELLSLVEREVIELFYGFRGDPKSDQEVANIMETPRVTASKRRERAVARMRDGLTAVA